MNKAGLFKQSKLLPTWMGGFLIQMQQSLVYVGILNIVMLAVTMWYTAGYGIVQKYLPFVSIWHFLTILAFGWLTIMFIDYKYLHPTRQRHLNRQVAKHKNPAMELLEKAAIVNENMQKDIAEIKKALNIPDGRNGESQK